MGQKLPDWDLECIPTPDTHNSRPGCCPQALQKGHMHRSDRNVPTPHSAYSRLDNKHRYVRCLTPLYVLNRVIRPMCSQSAEQTEVHFIRPCIGEHLA